MSQKLILWLLLFLKLTDNDDNNSDLYSNMPKTNPKRGTQTESNGEIWLCPCSSKLEISNVFCGMLHCVRFSAFKLQGHQSVGRDSKKDNEILMRLPSVSGLHTRENSAVESALLRKPPHWVAETPPSHTWDKGLDRYSLPA